MLPLSITEQATLLGRTLVDQETKRELMEIRVQYVATAGRMQSTGCDEAVPLFNTGGICATPPQGL